MLWEPHAHFIHNVIMFLWKICDLKVLFIVTKKQFSTDITALLDSAV